MPTDQEIAGQRKLLADNRSNLRHLLSQQVQYGGEGHASLDILNTLDRTRQEIHRIKSVLRGWHELVEDLPDDGDAPIQPSSTTRRQHIFLSYKRDADPDEGLARALVRELRAAHDVFLDRDLPIGVNWADSIRDEIGRCDALIVLLSARAVESEMVREEIALAHRLRQIGGHPRILPVRVAYHETFPYPLDSYLNALNWAQWEEPSDTESIINALKRTLEGAVLPLDTFQKRAESIALSPSTSFTPPASDAQPPQLLTRRVDLESPEGTMDPDSDFYIERASDGPTLESIKRNGVTITIKGPRQVGKSSLLMRLIAAAEDVGKHTVFVDFQLFDRSDLENQDRFYRQFCVTLSEQLDLTNRTDEYWDPSLGYNQRCTRYVKQYLLKETSSPLLLALDEVETVFDSAFRSDFFGMLRNWHNSRATQRDWKRLDLALVTSTEPYMFIDNLTQSPFNVGQIVDLEDFTVAQTHSLNVKHGAILTASDERQLYALLNGHPYLTRRALYLVASGRSSLNDLLQHATDMRGPFGDHLRSMLFRLPTRPELVAGLLQIINQRPCEERILFRLHGAGLIREQGRNWFPRCQLYATFFKEHLR